jgi:hypothetical protein
MPLTNPSGGVSDHGLLTGLADDDHTQYHNDTRGDLRYHPLSTDMATQAELNAHESDSTSVHGITNTANLYVAGGTDVALADGGTGASLADPGADRIMFWDDSASATAYLEASTGLSISGTTLTATAVSPIMCRATADHAISSATETDITGMAMTLAANTKYAIEYYLRCSANAATVGIQFYLTFGGTITRFDGNLDYYITVSAKGSVDVVNDTTSPFTFEPTVSHGNVVLMNCIYGLLEVGASGGTLQLQHGSETATLTTVLRGSWGRAVAVA